MPIDLACPQCRVVLRVPDEHAGRQACCPKCATTFQVPAPPAAAPEPMAPPLAPPELFAEDEPAAEPTPAASSWGWDRISPVATSPYELPALAGSTSDEVRLDWQPVRSGLGLVKVGFAIAIVVVILRAVADFSFRAMQGRRMRIEDESVSLAVVTVVVMLVLLTVGLIGSGLNIWGRLRCARAPEQSGAGGMALVSALVALLSLVGSCAMGGISFLAAGITDRHDAREVGMLMLMLGGATGLTGLMAEGFFLAFIYRLGAHLRNPAVVSAANRVVVIGILLLAVGAGMVGLAILLGDEDSRATLPRSLERGLSCAFVVIAVLGGLVGGLVLIVLYFAMLSTAQAAIDVHAENAAGRRT